jgi:hypothetical protein
MEWITFGVIVFTMGFISLAGWVMIETIKKNRKEK